MAEKIEKHEFYHTIDDEHGGHNELFYSIEGYYIPAELYLDVLNRHKRINREEEDVYKDILRDWGKNYKTERSIKIEQMKNEKRIICTLKELMLHIKTLLDKTKWEEIESKAKEKKNLNEIINLFPEIYRPLLRLIYAQQKKIGINKGLEMKSLVITIVNEEAFL